ncbi:hypothetical protein [Streptomyces sp. CAI-85]|uniref:hypothetical protein n=1 Tax=Streptomyces sp. CAI-85 TaxID=1472662 RepID=UPI00158772DD|nr:hypothetical protein [Streptomyces sp. CAI-85]NUV62598.1 hypothetical protein [Streptomyces sp. CAI-85]
MEPPRYRIRRSELAGDPHFSPVENGLDYLVSVIEHLESEDGPISARNLKYAVLHLAAGTEVLLKARLQIEHWSLVFAQPGTATRQALTDGSFSSCSPEETRQRLTNIVAIPFGVREKKALSDLARSRNALQHYGLVGDNADAGKAETTTAQVLNFLIGFIETHLLPHLEDQQRAEAEIAMERIRGGLHMIQAYAAERMRDLAPVLGTEPNPAAPRLLPVGTRRLRRPSRRVHRGVLLLRHRPGTAPVRIGLHVLRGRARQNIVHGQ